MSETSLGAWVAGSAGFVPAFVNAFLMIMATELGDKTFFIAAVLAMRNDRILVYSGAMLALFIMHILSAAMGYTLPALLPREYTQLASAVLFLYFGVRLIKDGIEMENDGPSEELAEVEQELINKKDKGELSVDVESGSLLSTPKSRHKQHHPTEKWKIFTQALSLTFLAEWGDRSQIATIAMAAAKNVFGVLIGGIIGHMICTGIAVLGGKMLASRISEKTVSIVGGILFLGFAFHSFYVGM